MDECGSGFLVNDVAVFPFIVGHPKMVGQCKVTVRHSGAHQTPSAWCHDVHRRGHLLIRARTRRPLHGIMMFAVVTLAAAGGPATKLRLVLSYLARSGMPFYTADHFCSDSCGRSCSSAAFQSGPHGCMDSYGRSCSSAAFQWGPTCAAGGLRLQSRHKPAKWLPSGEGRAIAMALAGGRACG